jgi:hypothetical protein
VQGGVRRAALAARHHGERRRGQLPAHGRGVVGIPGSGRVVTPGCQIGYMDFIPGRQVGYMDFIPAVIDNNSYRRSSTGVLTAQ